MTLQSSLMMVCHNGTCWEPFCCLSFILSQPHLDLLPVSIYCDVYLVIFHLLPLTFTFWWRAMVVAIKEWLSSDDDLLPFNVQWEPAFSERGSQPTCFSLLWSLCAPSPPQLPIIELQGMLRIIQASFWLVAIYAVTRLRTVIVLHLRSSAF